MLTDSVLAAFLLQASSGETKPYTPAPLGILLAWWICSRRKREPIGGWLMFFYWQMYGGVLVTLLFFALNIQSYVPENFDRARQFALFLASVLPGLILVFVQCAVATFLLSVRTWDMVRLLRWLMIADLGFSILGAAIDAKYFPENVGFSVMSIVATSIWLAYFLRSTRVQHVFYLRDWDAAVEKIYPARPSTRLIT